jgi:hypothetical protein
MVFSAEMAFFDEKLKEKTGHRSGSGYLRNGFDRQIQTNYKFKNKNIIKIN